MRISDEFKEISELRRLIKKNEKILSDTDTKIKATNRTNALFGYRVEEQI